MPQVVTGRIERLLELIGRINSTIELPFLLAAIMDAAKMIMEAEASSLMMLDEKTRELIVSVPTGPASAEISGMRIPPGKGFGGWVATHSQPLIVRDVTTDPRFYGDLTKSEFRTRSLICVPMKNARGEVMGVLQALNPVDREAFDESDLPLFMALADQASIAIEKAKLYEAWVEKEKLEQQLVLARDIQIGFWPKETPRFSKGSVAGWSQPAALVGGDYYDLVAQDPNRCALLVADISGKGMPAALLMASLHGALRAQFESGCPLPDLVSALNRMLVRDTPLERFVTLFCAVIDFEQLQLTYINAGHNPPLLFDTETRTVERLAEGGPVLGFIDKLTFTSTTVPLKRGNILVLYTDGITEAQDSAEEMYGEDRLIAAVWENAKMAEADQLLAAIELNVSSFCSGAPQYDDSTLVVARVNA